MSDADMSMETQLERLAPYFRARQEARDREIAAAWGRMTEREQRLVKDAAVMGYFRGTQAGRYPEGEYPKDNVVVSYVLDSCRTYPDLYPAVSELFGITPETDDEDPGE